MTILHNVDRKIKEVWYLICYTILVPILYHVYYFAGANDIMESVDLSWNKLRRRGAVFVAKGLKVCYCKNKEIHCPLKSW